MTRTGSNMNLGADFSGNPTTTAIAHDSENESIFESAFDLTEERLRYVFAMFDTDEDGRISYESLRRGLDLHTAGISHGGSLKLVDDSNFQQLVKHLDLDGSGDISFDEFSEGIRLLMLRALFRPSCVLAPETNVLLEVMDYDTTRLERHVVVGSSSSESDSTKKNHPPMNMTDFYFQNRPDWVKTRWINVVVPSSPQSSAAASLTMNRLAVKFLLHPLALEDALSPELHRPKAELYANLHYFLMIPVFCIESVPDEPRASGPSNTFIAALCRCFSWCFEGRLLGKNRSDQGRGDKKNKERRTRVAKVRIQMTSIFVNVPSSDTIITFTNGTSTEEEESSTTTTSTKNSSNNSNNSNTSGVWVRVQKELEKGYSKLRQYDAQYLTYALLDHGVDLLGPVVKTMRREVTRETEFLRKDYYRKFVRIHHLRDELKKICQTIKPFRRLLVHVIEDDAISPGATVYIRDVLDNLECFDDELKHLIEVCQGLDSEAEKFRSAQMDRTLYTLTVVSAVFLPAQFLTGVWGMNFHNMPELDENWGYPMFWALSGFMMVTLFCVLNFGRLRS
jgi:Mg2+ and Co2+ transporter CorA